MSSGKVIKVRTIDKGVPFPGDWLALAARQSKAGCSPKDFFERYSAVWPEKSVWAFALAMEEGDSFFEGTSLVRPCKAELYTLQVRAMSSLVRICPQHIWSSRKEECISLGKGFRFWKGPLRFPG